MLLSDIVGFFDHLEVKCEEVCFNIDALMIWIIVLVNENEVRVDLYPAVLSHSNANLIPKLFLCDRVFIGLGHRAELQKW